MATDVIMPQMGESIAEGTVTKWLKQVGDTIKRDEPLFEISTDKVDAEIPAPAEGVLLEIIVPEGETVDINTVVARIGQESESTAKPAPAPPKKVSAAPRTPEPAPAPTRAAPAQRAKVVTLDDRLGTQRKTRSSPLVRKIAAERSVDISLIDGTGMGGRVTKRDILQYLEHTAASEVPPAPAIAAVPAPAAPG
ncbi:MAG: biotin/lipoyl-containing protein, partial [Rhodothermales bacterium]